jgi:hypothetical protein
VYGEPRRGLADACAELRLPLHRFTWQPGMRRVGLRDTALYLIRPDGYVALADPQADPERLHHYFEERGIDRHVDQGPHAGRTMDSAVAGLR